MTPELSTERLLLRGWRDDDLDAYAEILADIEVVRTLGHDRPLDRAEAWRSMALHAGMWALRGYGNWVLERREDGRFLGRAGLFQPEGWPGLEVGWTLGRSFWGNGYATEAGRAAIDYAWEVLGAEEILSVILPVNLRSRRVAERLGLSPARDDVVGGHEVVIYRAERP